MRRMAVLCGLLACCWAGPAWSQERAPAELVPGARVRVHAQGRTVIGGVRALAADTLRITLWEQPGTWVVPVDSVQRIFLSQGRESRWSSAWRWGWRSGLVFPGLMAVLVAPMCASESSEAGDCGDVAPFLLQSAISGGIFGAIYGSFAPRERWIRLTIPSRR